MSTTGRIDTSLPATLESAGFVRLVTRADGDGLAAAGVLARALSARGTPFQVAVGRTVAGRTGRVGDVDERDESTVTIVIGAADADAHRLESSDRPATLAACDIVRDLGGSPDPVLALAGAFAAGVEPGAGETELLLEAARDRGLLEGRPGIAVPTDDLVDGLAHSTLCRGPWSGDREAVQKALEGIDLSDELDGDDHRRVGSLVALDVVGDGDASERAAEAIGRCLHPYATPDGPFATVGGYADVLEATARTDPGTGVALAIGHGVETAALSAWRTHARRTHEALDGASTGRYDGLFVVGVDGPVETAARLAATYRSPEPLALATGEDEAGLFALEEQSLGGPLEAMARELGAEYDVGRRRGYLRYDSDVDDSTIITTVRETL